MHLDQNSSFSPSGKVGATPTPQTTMDSPQSVDFITDMPMSQNSTVILIIIDRLSKFIHLIQVTELPTAFQTAELIFTHIFRYFGLLEEIVSDRGPQFTSLIRAGFMERLGITVSLTSGYHPQANCEVERANQEVRGILFSQPGGLGQIPAMGRVLSEFTPTLRDKSTHFSAW